MWYRRLLASCSVFLPTFLLKYSSLGPFLMLAFVSPQMFEAACFQGSGRTLPKCNSGEECTIPARRQLKGVLLTFSPASFCLERLFPRSSVLCICYPLSYRQDSVLSSTY